MRSSSASTLPRRVPELDDAEAARRLVVRAVTASGVADRRTVKDFYRLPPAFVDTGIAAALSAGDIERVSVAGRPWYARPDLVVPAGPGTALLAPFDPLVGPAAGAPPLRLPLSP